MTQRYMLPKRKKGVTVTSKQPINKKSSFILALLEYHVFLQALMKEVSMEARSKRSKVIKKDHVRAVGKRVLRKYKP